MVKRSSSAEIQQMNYKSITPNVIGLLCFSVQECGPLSLSESSTNNPVLNLTSKKQHQQKQEN